MRPLKDFNEFIKEGIIKKITPNIQRASSLMHEAEKRMGFVEEIKDKVGLTDKNANYFIENSYDILIELIRAKLLTKGFNSSGQGAHEAEVAYMRNLGFPENEARFMNDLRYFRNGILYYGKDFDKEYAEKVLNFLNKTYPKLKEEK